MTVNLHLSGAVLKCFDIAFSEIYGSLVFLTHAKMKYQYTSGSEPRKLRCCLDVNKRNKMTELRSCYTIDPIKKNR